MGTRGHGWSCCGDLTGDSSLDWVPLGLFQLWVSVSVEEEGYWMRRVRKLWRVTPETGRRGRHALGCLQHNHSQPGPQRVSCLHLLWKDRKAQALRLVGALPPFPLPPDTQNFLTPDMFSWGLCYSWLTCFESFVLKSLKLVNIVSGWQVKIVNKDTGTGGKRRGKWALAWCVGRHLSDWAHSF